LTESLPEKTTTSLARAVSSAAEIVEPMDSGWQHDADAAMARSVASVRRLMSIWPGKRIAPGSTISLPVEMSATRLIVDRRPSPVAASAPGGLIRTGLATTGCPAEIGVRRPTF
jgi:hypothetical protein